MVKKLVTKQPEKADVDIDKLLSKGAPVREDIEEVEKEESKWTHLNFPHSSPFFGRHSCSTY